MNIQEYIESGILDLYVMGALEPHEIKEVEQMAAAHPEVREELARIEKDTDLYLQSLSTPAPAHLRSKILAAATANDPEPEEKPAGKSVSLNPSGSKFRYIAYAAGFALIASLSYNFILFNRNKRLQSTIVKQQKVIESKEADYEKVYTAYYDLEDKMNMMASPENKMIHMKGLKNDDLATIVWNERKNEVYLALNKLEKAPDGKQYQLWAIVDNKPVDLGVFNAGMKSYEMLRMKDVTHASAFAVTVETMGGSPTPTMESMWLMGEV